MTTLELKSENNFWDRLNYAQKKDIQAGIDDLKSRRKKPLVEIMKKYF